MDDKWEADKMGSKRKSLKAFVINHKSNNFMYTKGMAVWIDEFEIQVRGRSSDVLTINGDDEQGRGHQKDSKVPDWAIRTQRAFLLEADIKMPGLN